MILYIFLDTYDIIKLLVLDLFVTSRAEILIISIWIKIILVISWFLSYPALLQLFHFLFFFGIQFRHTEMEVIIYIIESKKVSFKLLMVNWF